VVAWDSYPYGESPALRTRLVGAAVLATSRTVFQDSRLRRDSLCGRLRQPPHAPAPGGPADPPNGGLARRGRLSSRFCSNERWMAVVQALQSCSNETWMAIVPALEQRDVGGGRPDSGLAMTGWPMRERGLVGRSGGVVGLERGDRLQPLMPPRPDRAAEGISGSSYTRTIVRASVGGDGGSLPTTRSTARE
jgi:hypothetical protein